MKIRLIVAAVLLCAVSTHAYWEWTPRTNKWINPKYAVKDTPKEQYEWAESYRTARNLDQAIQEHRKLIKAYATSDEAARSYFALGEIYQEQNRPGNAFESYQVVIEKYPQSPLVIEAVKRQSDLAQIALKTARGRITELFKGKEVRASQLEQVIKNDPYARETADRQMKLAEFYVSIHDFERAGEALRTVITEFPESDTARTARYRLIQIEHLSVPKVSSSMKDRQKIQAEIDDFVEEYPDSEESKSVMDLRRQIDREQASKLLDIGLFYERTGKHESALIYFRKVMERFPGTPAAETASQKLALPKK